MSLNRAVLVVAVAGALLSFVELVRGGGEASAERIAFCSSVAWLAVVDERQVEDRARMAEIEDAHSRRWEP